MLDLLSRVPGIDSGVGLVLSSGSSSDMFLQLHYCSTFLKKGKRIVLITSHLNVSSYRIIFSRLALRWDSDMITFIDLDRILGDNLHVDVEKIHATLLDQSVNMSSLLIFDDVSVLERLGVESSTVLCLLNKLYCRMEADGLLLALFALKTNAFRAMSCKTDFIIHLAPIGLGFGKDVTGQMTVSVRRVAPVPAVFELLYLTGDRSVKCFYPGGSSFLCL